MVLRKGKHVSEQTFVSYNKPIKQFRFALLVLFIDSEKVAHFDYYKKYGGYTLAANSHHNRCNDHQHQTRSIDITSNRYALYERKTL